MKPHLMFGVYAISCTVLMSPVAYLLIGRGIWWGWFSPQHVLVVAFSPPVRILVAVLVSWILAFAPVLLCRLLLERYDRRAIHTGWIRLFQTVVSSCVLCLSPEFCLTIDHGTYRDVKEWASIEFRVIVCVIVCAVVVLVASAIEELISRVSRPALG
jgi:hypothetical protein